ncbi:MAG: phosphoribosylaminoimidazolesuccinocarboxamide synthase [Thermodesulfobacteriota bacterium]|jgi:phosphoribosylaminoimidazole-succinocarboxamide synthase|nr:phosphoribosylaminoimidazolesuccinocarboxamide synthase [Candidatus Dadabacteria bacterium]|tara:strand:- start:47641 stop:48537 length:897 start_codon:yes stop_codon:yes gene_type:complete
MDIQNKNIILESNIKSCPLINRGKVRDLYDLGDQLLIVSSDRISAYDSVLASGIYAKGEVLTQLSKFWFSLTEDIVENHYITDDIAGFSQKLVDDLDVLQGRSMVVKKAKPLPIECIVRGYITGSGWAEYKKQGTVCGLKLNDGLVESEKLSEPIFTPSTKAEQGEHDENINFEQCVNIVGSEVANKVKDLSIAIYSKARDYAESKGILIADTKFEFGTLDNGKIILIDEVLTPDSSRFWPKALYEAGRGQESYDKQIVRDYLTSIGWDKKPPPPKLPDEIAEKTSNKYIEVLDLLTQ